ncbi:MAG TPA: hypothetical protein VE968_07975, partial [Sphingomicrobium sp.]|nr:hypothetical protein [Sphingomicrobium sp.]
MVRALVLTAAPLAIDEPPAPVPLELGVAATEGVACAEAVVGLVPIAPADAALTAVCALLVAGDGVCVDDCELAPVEV